MSTAPSVSCWIEQLKRGDEEATARLWQRFYQRLVGLATRKLGKSPRRVADEEDVVVVAFATFVRRAREGHFPSLRDRDDLWHLLAKITERKSVEWMRGQAREKRGGHKVRGESALRAAGGAQVPGDLDQMAGMEPTPEFAAEAAENVQRLLGGLTPQLQQIALLKLEGYQNAEIAARLACSLPTVERKLSLIRRLWTRVLREEDH
jgi:RNA polymerase sigma factor (sigma-70 family)